MRFLIILSIMLFVLPGLGQDLYFPPLLGDVWETKDPAELDWCVQAVEPLYKLLEDNNTKAFLVLKDGRIVLEKYFGTFSQDSIWYWASAAKTLTSFLTGLAQEQGYLEIGEAASSYLGEGWTSCDPEMESKITIRNQLTMTTGLNDLTIDAFCTDPICLECLAEPGSRWAYHNAPYTLLDEVIQAATGKTLNTFLTTQLLVKTGINGAFFKVGYNNLFVSKARSMARFGLLILNKGNWNGNPIMQDTSYFNDMVHISQALNQSYGYLWWLNGKESFMLPGTQLVFPGYLHPNAPDDMISALGANGQILNIVPSQNLVLVRMGNIPEDEALGVVLNDKIWEKLNDIFCESTKQKDITKAIDLRVYPNPANERCTIFFADAEFKIELTDVFGIHVFDKENCIDRYEMDTGKLKKGIYLLRITDQNNQQHVRKFFKN